MHHRSSEVAPVKSLQCSSKVASVGIRLFQWAPSRPGETAPVKSPIKVKSSLPKVFVVCFYSYPFEGCLNHSECSANFSQFLSVAENDVQICYMVEIGVQTVLVGFRLLFFYKRPQIQPRNKQSKFEEHSEWL